MALSFPEGLVSLSTIDWPGSYRSTCRARCYPSKALCVSAGWTVYLAANHATMLAFSHRLIWLPPQLHCVCDDEAVIIWMFRFLFNIMRCGARGIRTIWTCMVHRTLESYATTFPSSFIPPPFRRCAALIYMCSALFKLIYIYNKWTNKYEESYQSWLLHYQLRTLC